MDLVKCAEYASFHLPDVAAVEEYMFSGRALVMVHNKATGGEVRFRVKVGRRKTEKGGWAPAHGVGPWDVEARLDGLWFPLGHVKRADQGPLLGRVYTLHHRHRRYSEAMLLGSEHPLSRAFAWLLGLISHQRPIPARVAVRHGGACGRCGADLISEYRLIGYGKDCCAKMQIDDRAIFTLLKRWLVDGESSGLVALRGLLAEGGRVSDVERRAIHALNGVMKNYALEHLARADNEEKQQQCL